MNELSGGQRCVDRFQGAGGRFGKRTMASLRQIVLLLGIIAASPPTAAAIDDLIVHDDALASGWQDWFYGEVVQRLRDQH